MTNWASAVAARARRLILTARIPAALDAKATSMLSAASWLCGEKIARLAAPAGSLELCYSTHDYGLHVLHRERVALYELELPQGV